MFSVVSRRKQMLMAADCSSVRGGASRVLTLPGRGAFAITVRAHWSTRDASVFAGLRIGYDIVRVDIALGRAPVGGLFFQHWLCESRRSFFADSVLIPAIALKINRTPGLGVYQRSKLRSGHDIGLAWFAVFPSGSTCQL